MCSITRAPAWIKLGEAQDIDRPCTTYARRCVTHKQDEEAGPCPGCPTHAACAKTAGEKRLVLLSPDGVLHLVPFAALVDEQERYLAERYRFIYLTTGRDCCVSR